MRTPSLLLLGALLLAGVVGCGGKPTAPPPLQAGVQGHWWLEPDGAGGHTPVIRHGSTLALVLQPAPATAEDAIAADSNQAAVRAIRPAATARPLRLPLPLAFFRVVFFFLAGPRPGKVSSATPDLSRSPKPIDSILAY